MWMQVCISQTCRPAAGAVRRRVHSRRPQGFKMGLLKIERQRTKNRRSWTLIWFCFMASDTNGPPARRNWQRESFACWASHGSSKWQHSSSFHLCSSKPAWSSIWKRLPLPVTPPRISFHSTGINIQNVSPHFSPDAEIHLCSVLQREELHMQTAAEPNAFTPSFDLYHHVEASANIFKFVCTSVQPVSTHRFILVKLLSLWDTIESKQDKISLSEKVGEV